MSASLNLFMDVALRAVLDLDARLAGAIRFGRAHGAALAAEWPAAGLGFAREDTVVLEIVRHYLLDANAIAKFQLSWEPHYKDAGTDARTSRADLKVRTNDRRERHAAHYIEAKWWWWPNDYDRIRGDREKLHREMGRSAGEPALGHLLIFTTADTSADWRSGEGSLRRELRENPKWAKLWQSDLALGAPLIRMFETEAGREPRVGALVLLPVVARGS